MPINSTEVSYGFGQMGSAHMHNDNAEDLSPPTGKTIVAITMLGDVVFDKLEPIQLNGVDAYFGTGDNANTTGNSEVIDTGVIFPKGLTIYGRWTKLSLNAAVTSGGIIAYFDE